MALYYRCPRCQALMDIDPEQKIHQCRYCGMLCTEDEAWAKIEELGSDEDWIMYRSNEYGTETAAATQTQVDRSAELEEELKQDAEDAAEAEEKDAEAEAKAEVKKAEEADFRRRLVLAAILSLVLLIGLPLFFAVQSKKKAESLVETLVMRTLDGEVDLSFPDAVLAKYSKMALDLPGTKEFVRQEYYQPDARRIINFTSVEAFFDDVVFANPYYFGAVCREKKVTHDTKTGEETDEYSYEFYSADKRKRTADPVDRSAGSVGIVMYSGPKVDGRELFFKDNHYFSLEFSDLFAIMDEYWMSVDELALYVRPNEPDAPRTYITFPRESQRNSASIDYYKGVYSVPHEAMVGFWDFEGLKLFYSQLSEDYCRIYESTQTIYVRLRCVGSGGFSDRVAKVVALEDHVEVSIVDSGVGREMFTK